MVNDSITWQRLRSIFGDPKPVMNVTQRQFDYCDEKLQQLGRTPYDQIDFSDLWYYHHDLAYSDLQPDLFAYLFPVCLMDWHRTLLANEPCSHGDSEFHYGLVQGEVLERMLTKEQRVRVEGVFRDSMLHRLDQERGLLYVGTRPPAHRWMARWCTLGMFLESLPKLWNEWWAVETPGRAVSALQYCSGLMYFSWENPIFGEWTPTHGGGGPYLFEHDSYIHDRGWTPENARYVAEFVTAERIVDVVQRAATALRRDPEYEQAVKIASKIDDCQELLKSRVSELPRLLAESDPNRDWSV